MERHRDDIFSFDSIFDDELLPKSKSDEDPFELANGFLASTNWVTLLNKHGLPSKG